MAFFDALRQFLSIEPMQMRVADPFVDAPDMDTQLAALRALPRPWRAPTIREALGVPSIQRAVTLDQQLRRLPDDAGLAQRRGDARVARPPRPPQPLPDAPRRLPRHGLPARHPRRDRVLDRVARYPGRRAVAGDRPARRAAASRRTRATACTRSTRGARSRARAGRRPTRRASSSTSPTSRSRAPSAAPGRCRWPARRCPCPSRRRSGRPTTTRAAGRHRSTCTPRWTSRRRSRRPPRRSG